MDRNVTLAALVSLIVVGFLLVWGWRKAVPAPPSASVLRAASPTPAPTPRLVYPDKPAVLSAATPTAPTIADESYWVWDNALLATRSLDDLFAYQQEDNRPPVGYPNGTTRNERGQTPKQRELLMAGYIIEVPEAARIEVLSWGSDDLAQIRVLEGKRAGSVGWINKHLLRYNHNGKFDAAFPVEVK